MGCQVFGFSGDMFCFWLLARDQPLLTKWKLCFSPSHSKQKTDYLFFGLFCFSNVTKNVLLKIVVNILEDSMILDLFVLVVKVTENLDQYIR
jgi:hypothetical protein